MIARTAENVINRVSESSREIELPWVVKTGLLMIISGIVVGGLMLLFWCLGLPVPFAKVNVKAIGINVAFLSGLFGIALMIWWALMSYLVPYRWERWKWKRERWEKLSEANRSFLSELFKPRYSEYVEKQGERKLTPMKKDRRTSEKEFDVLVRSLSLNEVLNPQELAEWMMRRWQEQSKNWKSRLFDQGKDVLLDVTEKNCGKAAGLCLNLCKMLDGARPEKEVLVKLIKKIFAIKMDENDPRSSLSYKDRLVNVLYMEEGFQQFLFDRMLKKLENLGFLIHVVNHKENKEEREITLPAWYLLEHLALRGALP